MTVALPSHAPRLLLAYLILVAAALFAPEDAMAQACSSDGISGIAFGSLNPSANTDVTTNVNFSCWGGGNQPTYYSMCLYITVDGTPAQEGGKRRLQGSIGGATHYVTYDLFGTAARINRIDNTLASSATFTATTPSETTVRFSRKLYARAYPPPMGAPAITYEGWGMQATVQYAWSHTDYPSSCSVVPPGGGQDRFTETLSGNTTANVVNACQLGTATNMNFGPVASLGTARDQTSSISLFCPSGTPWRVALSNGDHHSGTSRRMSGPGGYVNYDLYRNATRTDVWGNVTNSNDVGGSGSGNVETLTVFGRVPAQPSPAPGIYSDTITVTLTY